MIGQRGGLGAGSPPIGNPPAGARARHRFGVSRDQAALGAEPAGPWQGMPPDAPRVLDELGDAVVVADGSGTIVFVNQAAQSLLGWQPDRLVGQQIITAIPARFRPKEHGRSNRKLSPTT